MKGSIQLLSLVNSLIDPVRRPQAIAEITETLGTEFFIVFVPDPETGVLLAAPGFPQTLPEGTRWRQFLQDSVRSDEMLRACLPWPKAGVVCEVMASAGSDGSVIAFIGGNPDPEAMAEMLSLFPLLTAALKSEGLNSMLVAKAKLAGDLVLQSETLARGLDQARRAAHNELTERRKADAALQKAQEELKVHAQRLEKRVAERTSNLSEIVGELEAFSYTVAHDMRAPLRAMQGYASYVIEEFGETLTEDAVSALNKIRVSTLRLDRLIQDVLNYSRLVRGDFPMAPINLDALVPSIIDSYHDWHQPHPKVAVVGTLPCVIGNEAFLTQCVTNLVGNALKFVAPGQRAEVKISAVEKDEAVVLSIADNGIGIPERNLERIFQIFERLHGEKEFEGTGIGLAIVRKAVERMGGKIEVQSELGKGSTFSLHLKKAMI